MRIPEVNSQGILSSLTTRIVFLFLLWWRHGDGDTCLTGVQVEMVNLLDLQQLNAAVATSSGESDSEKEDDDVEMCDPDAKQVADLLQDLDLELDNQDSDDSDDVTEIQLIGELLRMPPFSHRPTYGSNPTRSFH